MAVIGSLGGWDYTFQQEFRAPYIHSLLLSCNPSLTEIQKEVIGSMTALRVLDFTRNALQSLPKNMGYHYRSDITQLPSDISNLTSLKLLDVSFCKHLQYMPYGMSLLTSLEYLDAFASSNIQWNKCIGDRLPISDLGTLNKLKKLGLHNNGDIIQKRMLGTMKQIENSFCEFQNLGYLSLFGCGMLKQLPNLHNLPSLKHLHIVECSNIEKFPEEFGKKGGFPKLEVFSVVNLRKMEQLPTLEEGALPSRKTLTIMQCEALQRLPQCYWNLKSVESVLLFKGSTCDDKGRKLYQDKDNIIYDINL
ncbi:leucine-rich repeat receptor-like protein kinase PXL1 [Cryptomeria japonica]|uniref:leucine-rich repeat receptor-like protein kinase PXL1 n=1 Tax=Cryptomeria japonica TaxID=3369 RepID=UPI0027D9D6F6|nr:leucine-rich repeat receptor-like protein kinase PXL1 [Cryptomeria japonica]